MSEASDASEPACTPEEEEVLSRKGLTVGKRINYGSFSKVHKGTLYGKDVAVKVIDLRLTSKEYKDKFLPRELEYLQKLRHPNIITIYKIVPMKHKIYIFMDFAEQGDVLEYLKINGPIPENRAKLWFKQSAEALRYIHNNNVAHRDIKSENILLDRYFNVKLTDFGFCREVGKDKAGKAILSKTYCGSAAYVAPEVLQSTPYDPKQSDIWSLGVVLFVMVNNALPFDDSDLARMVQRQLARQWHFSSKVVEKLSSELKDLIRSMLEPDPLKRPNLARIMKHPWLRDSPTYFSIGTKDLVNMAPKTRDPGKDIVNIPPKTKDPGKDHGHISPKSKDPGKEGHISPKSKDPGKDQGNVPLKTKELGKDSGKKEEPKEKEKKK